MAISAAAQASSKGSWCAGRSPASPALIIRPIPPARYLHDLFRSFQAAFHRRGTIAKFVAVSLAQDYFIDPLLPERILVALSVCGWKTEELSLKLDIIMAGLISFALIEIGNAGRAPHLAQVMADELTALPDVEFHMLKTNADHLVACAAKRGSAETAEAAADRFAHSV